ncbi:diacylglycerol kinase, catalytic region [Rivularia sp. IAM M-261]|nr:diacylglycerol kinase, catalytic region [Rivularia sp. IAM M-261]
MDRKIALLIVNPHARKGQEKFVQVTQYLKKLGFDLIEKLINDIKSLSQLIQQYHDQVDLVIIGGGDGTLNAALDGLVSTGLPLGILPLGTANDLARTLGIPDSLPEACQVIADGYTRYIDLGWVNGKYFHTVASLGLSVTVSRKVTQETKRRWGMLAYFVAALHKFRLFRPFKAEIRAKERSISIKAIQIVVGNGRYYAGGMVVAQYAAIDDQRLDLYSIEVRNWWHTLMLLPAITKGNFAIRHRCVQTIQAQEIEIYTSSKSRSIDGDGELIAHTPAHFRVIPHALSVFCSKSSNF